MVAYCIVTQWEFQCSISGGYCAHQHTALLDYMALLSLLWFWCQSKSWQCIVDTPTQCLC